MRGARARGVGWISKVVSWAGWILAAYCIFHAWNGRLSWWWAAVPSAFALVWAGIEAWREVNEEEEQKLLESLTGAAKARRDADDASDESPMVSLAIMRRTPLFLDEAILETQVAKVWGVEFDGGEDALSFVAGEPGVPTFMIKLEDEPFMYLVNNFDRPYMEDPEAAAGETPEQRLAAAVRAHTAWTSVDLIGATEDEDRHYPRLAQLLVALSGEDDALAVGVPGRGWWRAWDDEVEAALSGSNPLDAFEVDVGSVPVIGKEADDAEILAAAEEARRRWPEFVEAFGRRHPEVPFSVKVPITVDDVTEHIWVSVEELEGPGGAVIRGTLGNRPLGLRGLEEGDPVEVQAADVEDWAYPNGDALEGLFTRHLFGGEGGGDGA